MFRSKKALSAVIAFFVLLLTPVKGFTVEEDPYIYKTLVGTVYFEYQKGLLKGRDTRSERSNFSQVYSLEMFGNFISRRLFIYNWNATYTKNDSTSDNIKSESSFLTYSLYTTALPNSKIPLTLYGNRNHNLSGATSVSTNYGLKWLIKAQTLPQFSLYVDKNVAERADGTKSESISYGFDLRKELKIGPTRNLVTFDRATSSPNSIDKSTNTNLRFSNTTQLSSSTQFGVNTARHMQESATSESTSEGYTFDLNSTPSKDFSQNHTYTFFESESGGGTATGDAYSGAMYYSVSKDLSASLGLAISRNENQSATLSNESENMNTSGGISYRFSDRLSLSQSVTYISSETDSQAASVTTANKYKTFSSMTSLIYSQPLAWGPVKAGLGASYGVGYSRQQADAVKNNGMNQAFSASLGGITVDNRYIDFSSSLSYAKSNTAPEDLNYSSKAFSLTASNKVLRKYARITSGYNKSVSLTWVPGGDTKNESYSLTGNTVIARVPVEAYFNHLKSFNEIAGWTSAANGGASLSHSMKILKNPLTTSLSYSYSENDYAGGSDRSTTTSVSSRYGRRITRYLVWSSYISWLETKTNQNFNRTFTVDNSFIYPLRAWRLSFTHKYTLRELGTSDVNENLYIFRATRSFVRIFL